MPFWQKAPHFLLLRWWDKPFAFHPLDGRNYLMLARMPKKTVFREGDEAAKRFDSMMDAVLRLAPQQTWETYYLL